MAKISIIHLNLQIWIIAFWWNPEYAYRQALVNLLLFQDGDPYYIKNSPLICTANPWTGFYMSGISIMKEFIHVRVIDKNINENLAMFRSFLLLHLGVNKPKWNYNR